MSGGPLFFTNGREVVRVGYHAYSLKNKRWNGGFILTKDTSKINGLRTVKEFEDLRDTHNKWCFY